MSFSQVIAAAGKFSNSQPKPGIADDKDHPVNIWTLRLPMVRKMMVGNHPLIVGLGFLDRNFNLRILSAPCPDLDSFEDGSQLGGSLGDFAFAANPVMIDEGKIFGDVMTMIPADDIPEGSVLTAGPIQTVGDDAIAPDTSYQVVVVPISLPLLAGHGLVEGPIASLAVKGKLQAYCGVAGAWAAAASWLNINPGCSHKLDPFDASTLPSSGSVPELRASMPVPYDAMFDPMDGDRASLFARVSTKVAEVCDKNSAS